MHVGAKKIATAGLLVSFSVILVVMSSVIETSSLFFIAAGSFCVGISIREWGLRFGFGFLLASVILNFMLAPNKMYCITFAAMGIYIWASEFWWEHLAKSVHTKNRMLKLWIGKYLCFNIMYIPTVLFLPTLIYAGKINGWIIFALLVVGQVALLIFDIAYRTFQSQIWGRLRTRFL